MVLTTVALHHQYASTPEFIAAAHQASPDFEWLVLGRSLYVLLLQMVNGLVGDMMLSGGMLSVFAGIGSVVAATRLFGPWAGLWLLANVGFLMAATVPGPAMLAAMCILWALYTSQEGSGLATGLLVFHGFLLTAWTLPVGVVVLFLSRHRVAALCGFFVPVLWVQFVVPDFIRLPVVSLAVDSSMLRIAGKHLMSEWTVWLGCGALIWGAFRGNRASRLLIFMATVSVLSGAIVLGTPKEMFVAQLLILLGVAAVETGPALLVASLILLGFRLPLVWDGTESHQGLVSVIHATAMNPDDALCTSSAFVRPALTGGGIRPCFGLESLAHSPTEIFPKHVLQAARVSGSRLFAAEDEAILHTYPWLQDLLGEPYPNGFALVKESQGWRVFSVSP